MLLSTADLPHELITEEVVIPDARTTSTPEQRLLVAVLVDAIRCAESRGVRGTGKAKRELRAAAVAWFDDAAEGVFTYRSICSILGLDAQRVREQVQQNRVHLPNHYSHRKRGPEFPAPEPQCLKLATRG